VDDDVISHLHVFHQGKRNILAHAAQVDDGLIVGGNFHHSGRDGQTHGYDPFR
jgi:hypothetical protein